MPSHRAWTSASLCASLYIQWQCTEPQIETHILYPLHNNSSVHLTTITKARWNAERLEMESTTKVHSFIPDPPSWNGPAKNNVGLAQVLPHQFRTFPVCTTGVWMMRHPLLRLVSVIQKIKPLTMLSSDVQTIDILMDCMA